jgi:adenylate cyclase
MTPFLAELKRRKVVRVAMVYAAAAFAVLQAADVMLPRLGVPDWAMTLIVVLVVLGFPLALVLGWALELTPAGVRVTSALPASDDALPPSLLGRRTLVAAALLVALGVGLGAGLVLSPAPPTVAPAADRAIAVLPFADLSPDGGHEWFSDGLAEELLNALAALPGLRVAARTSSFALKEEGLAVEEVARRLNVTHVLEGSVRRSADRLRISAQLINAADGYQLWSRTYDRWLADIFEIQEDIARAIVHELRGRLGVDETLIARATRTTDPETYDLYLRGRHYWRSGGRAELELALDYFHQAVARDPQFALAWVGLADGYSRLANWGHRPPREMLPRGRAAAQRAVELDSLLAPARATLGHILRWWDHDRIAAERELRRALELQPHDVSAREYYAWFLADAGRTAEAVEHHRQATELDPLSPSAVMLMVNMLVFDGRWDEAIAQFERGAQVIANPTGLGSTSYAYALYRTGRIDEAIAMLEAVPQPRTLHTGMLGYLYAVDGRADVARRILAQLRTMAQHEYVAAMNIAVIHVGLGEHEAALDALELAWRQGSLVPQLNVMPELAPLRGAPRFQELLRRLGLETGRGELPTGEETRSR